MATVKLLFLFMQRPRSLRLWIETVGQAAQDRVHVKQDGGSVGRRCHDLLERLEELLQSGIVYACHPEAEYKLRRLAVRVSLDMIFDLLWCVQDACE